MKIIVKYIGPSIYKYVCQVYFDNRIQWQGSIKNPLTGKKNCKYFDIEREAAVYVDKQLLRFNKEPVNILKRKPGIDSEVEMYENLRNQKT